MNDNDTLLIQISKFLDISPSDYKRATERFNAVKLWLLDGNYKCGSLPEIYLQGSFRLGTVVKPYRGDNDGNFDIDQVCQLTKVNEVRSPQALKHDIGDRLKENDDYKRMLDDEGKRCWTLEYASEADRPGFHLDILPSIPLSDGYEFQIDITNKDSSGYSWSISNPNGYYYWFKARNIFPAEQINKQRMRIYEANQTLYNNYEDVPLQLLRTPLQQAIQLMKRHRDVYFCNRSYKPISIIITTITAHVHSQNKVQDIIYEFIEYVMKRYKLLLKDGYLTTDGILDYENGEWVIPNPVDQINQISNVENFADKWNEEIELSYRFFEWVSKLYRDIFAFERSGASEDLNLKIKKFNDNEHYSVILIKEIKEEIRNYNFNTYNYLRLIHLGIEKKVDWTIIKEVAQLELDNANKEDARNIAKINYYQIARHRGIKLSDSAISDVKQILESNRHSAAFTMCCNLILGTANREMISQCISDFSSDNVLQWPILKLANMTDLLPKNT